MAGKKPPEFRVVCRLSSSELEPLESVEYSFARLAFLIFLCAMLIRLFRAVARFFVTRGGGCIIASAKGMNLVGGLGVSFPRKFSNLEALKRYF